MGAIVLWMALWYGFVAGLTGLLSLGSVASAGSSIDLAEIVAGNGMLLWLVWKATVAAYDEIL